MTMDMATKGLIVAVVVALLAERSYSRGLRAQRQAARPPGAQESWGEYLGTLALIVAVVAVVLYIGTR